MLHKSLALMGASVLAVSLAGCAATGNSSSSNAASSSSSSSSMMSLASSMLSSQTGQTLPAADLMSSLTSQLGVSSTQALGGSAAMLAGSATRLAGALCQRETQSGRGFPDLPLLHSEHYS